MTDPAQTAATFESLRPELNALAYRMTGAVADAEDIVQQAYLRWERTDQGSVRNPRAFLSRTVTRLCLDWTNSARMRRETYVGSWLPEPLVGEYPIGAETAAELAEDVSMALMMALERLSPLERAALVLRDAFDASYPELAATLGRSEESCRQLVSRARVQVKEARPKYRPTREECRRLVMAFGAAVTTGDVDTLTEILAEDAVLYSDGGGKVVAALRPIVGADRVVRFLLGVLEKFPPPDSARIVPRPINGVLGFVLEDRGSAVQAMAFDVRDGEIGRVYVVRNPDKLTHLSRAP